MAEKERKKRSDTLTPAKLPSHIDRHCRKKGLPLNFTQFDYYMKLDKRPSVLSMSNMFKLTRERMYVWQRIWGERKK